MLKFWLMGDTYELKNEDVKSGTAPIYTLSLDWDWAFGYTRFKSSYNELQKEALNEAGRNILISRLKSESNGKLWQDGGNFNFSEKSKEDWSKYYFNLREVGVLAFDFNVIDGMTAVLANHTIRALAEGTIKVLDDGIREITVTNLYFYIDDRFQFEGEYNLRYWSKEKLDYRFYSSDTIYVNLNNTDFNVFRKKFSKGRDFLVLSSLKKVDHTYNLGFYAI